jgi:hypothetical protein
MIFDLENKSGTSSLNFTIHGLDQDSAQTAPELTIFAPTVFEGNVDRSQISITCEDHYAYKILFHEPGSEPKVF